MVPRVVTISPVLNGYKVTVGCTEVVFSSRSELLRELEEYLRDPAGTEGRFVKHAINKMVLPLAPQDPGIGGGEDVQRGIQPGQRKKLW